MALNDDDPGTNASCIILMEFDPAVDSNSSIEKNQRNNLGLPTPHI